MVKPWASKHSFILQSTHVTWCTYKLLSYTRRQRIGADLCTRDALTENLWNAGNAGKSPFYLVHSSQAHARPPPSQTKFICMLDRDDHARD